MDTGRLEAFSDGVIAIIITIAVLTIEPPADYEVEGLVDMLPLVGVYAVSFFVVGVNWVNHHHLMEAVRRVNGRILWANLLYIFALSLIPVAAAWVGKARFAPIPVSFYMAVHLGVMLTYLLLEWSITSEDCNEEIREALRQDKLKETLSVVLSVLALILSCINSLRLLSFAALLMVTALWVVPDLRVVETLDKRDSC